MCLSIIFLPLVGFVVSGVFGNVVGRRGSIVTAVGIMVLVVLLAGNGFYNVGLFGIPRAITLGTWVNSGLFVITWEFIFDMLSGSMLFMVSMISLAVHVYSGGYMSEDPNFPRFISYLSLFTFFMFILVSADNFIQLFLGWEGVGMCSYLLINFWYTRVQANKAALKAMIMNRIGDFGFLVGVLLIFYFFRTVDFATVFVLAPYFTEVVFSFLNWDFLCLDVSCLFFFIGAMGKSAQLGLHTWLPDAMEGPTPVSALIHAATMVTAGIFLIIRCSPLFEFAPTALLCVTIIGVLTAFFAATVGIVQNDIKKVIAFSTSSQLGYMTFICGLSAYDVSLFHLVNHAFFKALLFLSAGSVIHALSGEQDMRKFGGLGKLLPYTYSMFLVGSLALAGTPFLSGFYSKDLILEVAFSKYVSEGFFAYWLGSLAAGFTAFYSIRLLYLTFFYKTRAFGGYIKAVHELPLSMGTALMFLGFGSIFVGFLLKDAFVGVGTSFWGNTIFIGNAHSSGFDFEVIPFGLKMFPLVASTFGMVLAYVIYHLVIHMSILVRITEMPLLNKVRLGIFRFLSNKWYFDSVYNFFIGYTVLHIAYKVSYKLIDKGLLEIVGPTGVSRAICKLSQFFGKRQSGYIHHYLSIIICYWVIFLILLSV